jgi:hypothetical protein
MAVHIRHQTSPHHTAQKHRRFPVETDNDFKILNFNYNSFSGLYFLTVQCSIFKQGSTHPLPVSTTPHNARTP